MKTIRTKLRKNKFFAHCFDPTLEVQYKGIYTPNCRIDDEIHEGYGERNIIDYLFDKGFIVKDEHGNSVIAKDMVKTQVNNLFMFYRVL